MVKLKKSPKNLKLDTKCSKNGQFRVSPWQAAIPWQTANSTAWRENPRAAEYC